MKFRLNVFLISFLVFAVSIGLCAQADPPVLTINAIKASPKHSTTRQHKETRPLTARQPRSNHVVKFIIAKPIQKSSVEKHRLPKPSVNNRKSRSRSRLTIATPPVIGQRKTKPSAMRIQYLGEVTNGLVADWRAADGYDDAVSGIPASPSGDVSITGSGEQFDYEFTGAAPSLNIPSMPRLTAAESFTIAAHVYCSSLTSSLHNAIFSQTSADGADACLMLSLESGDRIRFHMMLAQESSDLDVYTPQAVPLNQWIAVACTVNAKDGIAILYINGRSVASRRMSLLPELSSSTSVSVGSAIGGFNFPDESPSNSSFSGKIDDVRIYSRALDKDEIAAIADKFTTPIAWAKQSSLPIISLSSSSLDNSEDAVTLPSDPDKSLSDGLRHFTWFGKQGTQEWIEYEFSHPCTISGVSVYWSYSNDGSVELPGSWQLLYKDGPVWRPVEEDSGFNLIPDEYNSTNFNPVRTTGLRIVAALQPNATAGILRWRLSGIDNAVRRSLPTTSVPVLGSTRVNDIDGAEAVFVPAGDFTMGSNKTTFGDCPEHAVTLDGYWIYQTPVTVGQFRRFCNDTGYPMPQPPAWGWISDHPILNVTWNEANAYASWANASLPTEAEWEKAARGTDFLQYPWGNTWDSSLAVHSVTAFRDLGRDMPVGSIPGGASPYSALDMAGECYEWVNDWYASTYSLSPPANPTGPVSGDFRIVRGGSWASVDPKDMSSYVRKAVDPSHYDDQIGFRCVLPIQ